MTYGLLVGVFEELACRDNPFSEYPIVRIWPKA